MSFEDSLYYVESAKGDYLPADAFFESLATTYYTVDSSFGRNVYAAHVAVTATTLDEADNGDGTLATLTFKVRDFKASTLILSQVYLVDSDGKRWEATTANGAVTVPPEPVEETVGDINRDGVVDILDLTIVGARLGQRGQNSADLNGDGLVDIVDLVLVASEFGGEAAAPSLYPQALELLTAADVRQWLSQAQQLALTDPAYLRGINVLEQLHAALIPQETPCCPTTRIRSTRRRGFRIAFPTPLMLILRFMIQEEWWCVGWIWGIRWLAIIPIGRKRRIGTDAMNTGSRSQAESISINSVRAIILPYGGW